MTATDLVGPFLSAVFGGAVTAATLIAAMRTEVAVLKVQIRGMVSTIRDLQTEIAEAHLRIDRIVHRN